MSKENKSNKPNEPDYSIIGDRIRQARKNKNLSQQALSDKMEITPAYLSKVENGKDHFNVQRLTEASQILEVPEGYFLDGTSINSNSYLDKELHQLMKKCSPKNQKVIYDIAKVIAKSEEDS